LSQYSISILREFQNHPMGAVLTDLRIAPSPEKSI
jgi:hypothetical protein